MCELGEGVALLALGVWMLVRLRANVEWVIRRGKRWERRRRAMRAFERSGNEAAEVLELGRRTPNEVYKGMYAMARKYAPGVKMRQYGDRIFMIRRDADENQHRVRAGKR